MSFQHSSHIMSFAKLFNNPSTSQSQFCNFGFRTWTVILKEFIKIANGVVGKLKKGKKLLGRFFVLL